MKQSTSVVVGVFLSGALLLWSAATAQQDAARPLPKDIGAGPGHLPKVHYVPSDAWRQYPIWVDASLVLNQDGSINTSLIPKQEGEWSLKPLLTAPRQHGCVPAGGVLQDIANAPDRLRRPVRPRFPHIQSRARNAG